MEIPEDLEITLQEVRSQWEFASICQFLNLFYNAVGLETFDTDEFETDLITGKSNANIIKLQMKLLKSLTGLNNILLDNYQKLIINEYKKRNLECTITEELDYFDLPIREKILILYNLCEWQFENSENFRTRITEEDQQTWRVDPIGYDQKGNTYWLFDDNRLYKELPDVVVKPKPRKGKRRHRRDTSSSTNSPTTAAKPNKWQLVCLTSEDWNNFPKQFENTKYQVEKEFYEFITTHIIPKVLDALKSKEKKRRLQEAIVHRKRSSRIQMKEIEKFERERKAELERLRREEELRIKREEEKRRKEEERLRQIQLERERRIKEREEKIRLREEQKQKEREERELREMRRRRNEEGPGKNGEPFEFKCICGNNELDVENNEVPLIVCEKCNTWMHIPCLAMKLLRFTEQPLLLYDDDIEDWKRILFICPRCKAKELNIDYDQIIQRKKRGRPKLTEEESKRKKKEKKQQKRKKRKVINENGEVVSVNDDSSSSGVNSNNNNVIVDSNGQVIKLSKYKLKKLEETPEQKAERERLKQERKELRRKLRLEKKLQLKMEKREQRRKERLEKKEQEKLQRKLEKEKLRQEKKEKLQMEKLIEKMKKKNLIVYGPVGPDGQPPLLVPNQLKQHKPRVKKQPISPPNNQILSNTNSVSTSNFSEGSTSNNEYSSNPITSSNESTPVMSNSLQSYSSMMYSDNSSVTLNELEGGQESLGKKPRKKMEPKYDENGNIIPNNRNVRTNIPDNTMYNQTNTSYINQNNILSMNSNRNPSSNQPNFSYSSNNNNSSIPNNAQSWNPSMMHLIDNNKNYNIINHSKNSATIPPQILGNSMPASKNLPYGFSNSSSLLPNNILHNRHPDSNPYLNQNVNNNSGLKPLYPLFSSNPIIQQVTNQPQSQQQQQHHQPQSQPPPPLINPKIINNIPMASNTNYTKLMPKPGFYPNHMQIHNSNFDSSNKNIPNNENKNISNYSQQTKVNSNSQNYINSMNNKVNGLNYSPIEDRNTIHPSALLSKNNNINNNNINKNNNNINNNNNNININNNNINNNNINNNSISNNNINNNNNNNNNNNSNNNNNYDNNINYNKNNNNRNVNYNNNNSYNKNSINSNDSESSSNQGPSESVSELNNSSESGMSNQQQHQQQQTAVAANILASISSNM